MAVDYSEVQNVIYDRMVNDTDLINLLGGNHIYNHVPEDIQGVSRHIRFNLDAFGEDDTKSGEGYNHALVVHIFATVRDDTVVLDIASRINFLFNRKTLTLPGDQKSVCLYQTSIQNILQSSGNSHHVVQTFNHIVSA